MLNNLFSLFIQDSEGSKFVILNGPIIFNFIIEFVCSLFIKIIEHFGFGLIPDEWIYNLY